jgi:hypothetical protein
MGNGKLDMKNTKFRIINQIMKVTCHMEFLEKDFYFGTLSSFEYVSILLMTSIVILSIVF